MKYYLDVKVSFAWFLQNPYFRTVFITDVLLHRYGRHYADNKEVVMNKIENRSKAALISLHSVFSSPHPTTQTNAAENQQLCNSQFDTNYGLHEDWYTSFLAKILLS